jgi:hypothetical protein
MKLTSSAAASYASALASTPAAVARRRARRDQWTRTSGPTWGWVSPTATAAIITVGREPRAVVMRARTAVALMTAAAQPRRRVLVRSASRPTRIPPAPAARLCASAASPAKG